MNVRTETMELLLYGLATGLVGLLGWELYRARSNQTIDVPPRFGIERIWDRAVADGLRLRPDERTWDYGPRQEQWWQTAWKADWTGGERSKTKRRVDPGGTSSGDDTKPKPLADIISLKLVLAGGDDTRCLVQHEQHDVEVPAGALECLDLPVTPGQPAMLPDGTPILQVMVPGDTLWRPYADIEFERVDATGPYAIFSRTSPKDPNERIEERLVVDELAIDTQSFELGGDATTGRSAAGGSEPASDWRDPGDRTRHIGNAWMVSVKDGEMLSRNYEDVFRDCGLEDFCEWIAAPGSSSKPQRVRGVSIRRVPRRLSRFAMQPGDVLIKVNGTPVTSKASAIRVAKDLLRRGVRRFELTFLRKGREVVRVYQVPDKK